MARCEVCGNEYDQALEISLNGQPHSFDCFECAIHALAPRCVGCGVTVLGHGVQQDQRVFCGAHCAEAAAGVTGLVDRL